MDGPILGNMQDALETFSNFCVKTFTPDSGINVALRLLNFEFFFHGPLIFINLIFLIAILHRDLRNCFFIVTFHLLSMLYLDFYFPFSIWTFISFISFLTFIPFFDFYFPFCTNCDVVKFFQYNFAHFI